jgi:hypothetical protein
MQMSFSGRTHGKTVLIVLLLCATAFAQFAALTDSHTLHFTNDHCCLLCHIGVLPFLQPDAAMSAAPVVPVEWLPWNSDRVLFRDTLLVSRSTRAPPADFHLSAV